MICKIVSQIVSVHAKYWAFTYIYHCAAINFSPHGLKIQNKCTHANYTLKSEGSKKGPCDADVNSQTTIYTVFQTWADIKAVSVRMQTQLSLKQLEHVLTDIDLFCMFYEDLSNHT